MAGHLKSERLIHATREFARRFSGQVYMNYFLESQRGSYDWNYSEHIVQENRTEALDASRKVVRDGKIVFPRAGQVMREFADHLAADMKRLKEDSETGARSFRYVRTRTNHYSFAFTYDCIAGSRDTWFDPSLYGWIGDDDYWDPFIHGRF